MVVQPKNETENIESSAIEDSSNIRAKTDAITVLNALKKRKQTNMTNGFNSLEILRENLQYYFNNKISLLMDDFMSTYFEPAMKNIKENTNETISENQIQKISKNLLESCIKSQYSSSSNDSMSSPTSSSLSRNTPENSDSDSATETTNSLLHQALKRKRSDSETEQLFKRQFFLTTAPPNYFNSTTNIAQSSTGKIFKPSQISGGVLAPTQTKFITRVTTQNAGSGIFTNTNSNRPIFHIIQKNLLSATHVELAQLLQQNNSNLPSSSSNLISAASNQEISSRTITTIANQNINSETKNI